MTISVEVTVYPNCTKCMHKYQRNIVPLYQTLPNGEKDFVWKCINYGHIIENTVDDSWRAEKRSLASTGRTFELMTDEQFA